MSREGSHWVVSYFEIFVERGYARSVSRSNGASQTICVNRVASPVITLLRLVYDTAALRRNWAAARR